MATLARLAAILLLTLGFQIHGFVGAITAAHAGACVVAAAPPGDNEAAPLPPEKPSPSCKLIGAGHHGLSAPIDGTLATLSPRLASPERASWRPAGPEKPPKLG